MCQVAFKYFENQLLNHQQQYFAGLPFPYAAQTGLNWQLLRPSPNECLITKTFASDQKGFKPEKATVSAVGGTVVLRHFWHPLVTGVLENPQENTT